MTSGQTLSHYRLLEKIGEGGMGVVWKAEDTVLNRTVAIKVLPADVSRDEKRREMFLQEAQLAAQVGDAHIVQVYEFGRESGLDFIVMEYVEGKPLNKMLHGRPHPPHKVADFGHQIARALSRAHRKQLLHRDLKPANILVTPDGEAKVVDFGLATLFEPSSLSQTVTRTSEEAPQDRKLAGTLSYMSPEQARMEQLDGRSDVFSLGAILYEMTTGQLPFTGRTPPDVLQAVQQARPTPVHDLAPQVPLDLDRIIGKAMAPRQRDRYQSMEDLAVDLSRLGRELESGSSPSYEDLIKEEPGRRRKKKLIPLVVAASAMVVIIGLASFFAYRQIKPPSETDGPPRRNKIVVLPFENLGPATDQYFASGITEEITSRLVAVSGLSVVSRTSAAHYSRTGKTLREIGADLNVGYVLEGTVRWNRSANGRGRVRITPQLIRVDDDTHLWAETYDRLVDDIFDVQSEIASQVIQALGVALLGSEERVIDSRPTENFAAYQAYLRGLHYGGPFDASTEEHVRLAIQMLERAVALDPAFVLAYVQLSKAHAALYHYGYDRTEERLAMAKRAADIAAELDPGSPQVHFALGYYHYWGRKDYDRAIREFAEAKKHLPNDDEVLAAMAFVWRRQGRWEDSLEYLREAVELNPHDSELAIDLGDSYMSLRRYAEAAREYDRSIALMPDQSEAYVGKAMTHWSWTGDTARSRAALEAMPAVGGSSSLGLVGWFWQEVFEGEYEAALARLSAFPSEVVKSSTRQLLAAQVFRLMQRPEPARAAFASAAASLEKECHEHPEDFWLHSTLGIAYAGLGRRDEAIREGQKAAELYPISKDSLAGPAPVKALALVYTMLGERDAALDRIEYLLSIPDSSIAYLPLVPSETSVSILRLDPRWKPLWDEPRFQAIVAEVKKRVEEK